MSITIDLQPETELDLLAQAEAQGVSLKEYLEQIVAREAKPKARLEVSRGKGTGRQLVDACDRVRGLLTNEEVDTLFARTPSTSRPVDFS